MVCLDLVDNPESVKKAMVMLWEAWAKVHEETYYKLVCDKQEGTTGWVNLWAPGKFYPAESDLSLLISPEIFQGFLVFF